MPESPALDPAAIETLRALSPGDPEFLRELIAIYLEDTPKRLAEVEGALAKRDGQLLVRAAHTIKGSSGNFGATTLARLAQEIEACGKSANFAGAVAALPAFKAEYVRVNAALSQLAAGT